MFTNQRSRQYRWRQSFQLFQFTEQSDREYGWFVCRFWQLYQDARKARGHVSVKLLDHFLLSLPGTP